MAPTIKPKISLAKLACHSAPPGEGSDDDSPGVRVSRRAATNVYTGTGLQPAPHRDRERPDTDRLDVPQAVVKKRSLSKVRDFFVRLRRDSPRGASATAEASAARPAQGVNAVPPIDTEIVHGAGKVVDASATPALRLVNQVMSKVLEDHYLKPGNLRSDNKFRPGVEGDRERADAASRHLAMLEGMPLDEIDKARMAKAHNCSLLSVLAEHYLGRAGERPSLIDLDEADHNFAVIGLTEEGDLPKDMAEWPKTAHVCDPWLGIACPAREFPQKFREEMVRWNDAGVVVFLRGKETSPVDEGWIKAVLEGHKKTC